MTKESDPKLERMDPESEACFAALAERIHWELSARLAMGDDPSTEVGGKKLSELIADTVLDAFVVRTREWNPGTVGAPAMKLKFPQRSFYFLERATRLELATFSLGS